jgi:uncharacterized protein (TIGR02186 family)
MHGLRLRRGILAFLAVLIVGLLAPGVSETMAQKRKGSPVPVAKEVPGVRQPEIKRQQQPGANEWVEATVSKRTIAVTSSFNGTEIFIFGAIGGSQQPSAESGYYDVVVVVEGAPSRAVVRRKSNVAGLWLNTASVAFDNVPNFYAMTSTRPVDEIASDKDKDKNNGEDPMALYGIGLDNLKFTPAIGQSVPLSNEDIKAYRAAIIRLKTNAGLYVDKKPFGVVFTGKSIFLASVVLPANVSVGPFWTRVYLFRDGKFLSSFSVNHTLEREGLERYLHNFAYRLPTLYGFSTVLIALGAGLVASAAFRRGGPA